MFARPDQAEVFYRQFEPISLDALNAKAAMLERLDNKYVVPMSTWQLAVERLNAEFDVLEIEGRRSFEYRSWYFDDGDMRNYFDHHQGRRKRLKVRIRKYVDAGLCFLEVKLKDKRGITVKKRLPYDMHAYGLLNGSALHFIAKCFREQYQEPFQRTLHPVIEIGYFRTTLVAKSGGERLTVDNALQFVTPSDACAVDAQLFIIETKSSNGNGLADRILRTLNQHPTKNCSKYCIGLASTGLVEKYNRFRPALRKLGSQRLFRDPHRDALAMQEASRQT